MANCGEATLAVLRALLAERSVLGPLRVMGERVGRFFRVPLPGFRPYVVFGPDAARKVFVVEREKLLWRNHDPVTDLLGHGVLVTDGAEHDRYRAIMEPSLSARSVRSYTDMMARQVDRVSAAWRDGETVDMLVEGRKIALLIVLDALFGVDAWDDLPRIWTPVLKAIDFISPGMWLLWRRIPRPSYKRALVELDDYLFELIASRRLANGRSRAAEPDLLQRLIDADLPNTTIRDQMLTMLIAGHDTSTALLAWTFVLLGRNPTVMGQLTSELDSAPPDSHPHLLDEVIKESLRLHPPIHVGNRIVAKEVTFGEGKTVPAGARLFYSIYLTHRDPAIWQNAASFRPERFAPGRTTPPMSFIPFGAGPRACMGAVFGQLEAHIVISLLLRTFDFQLLNSNEIRPHMGATLEPRPGVLVRVRRRRRTVATGRDA